MIPNLPNQKTMSPDEYAREGRIFHNSPSNWILQMKYWRSFQNLSPRNMYTSLYSSRLPVSVSGSSRLSIADKSPSANLSRFLTHPLQLHSVVSLSKSSSCRHSCAPLPSGRRSCNFPSQSTYRPQRTRFEETRPEGAEGQHFSQPRSQCSAALEGATHSKPSINHAADRILAAE